jgi:hypothetical protein
MIDDILNKAAWFKSQTGLDPDVCVISSDVMLRVIEELENSGNTAKVFSSPMFIGNMMIVASSQVGPKFISPLYGLSL